MKKIEVDDGYTYETDLDLKVGDMIDVPVPYWLHDVMGKIRTVRVVSLESDYRGSCTQVIRKHD